MVIQQEMRTSHVQIVDPQYGDYGSLLKLAASAGCDLNFTRTGHAALKIGRRQGVDLWIVSTELPDMSGYDLLGMLRSVKTDAAVFMIDDTYRFESEQRAVMLQATQYLCKPATASWLAEWSGAMHLASSESSGIPP